MKKIFYLFILTAIFSTAGVFAFADQPTSSLDDKPSVDQAASSAVQVPAVPADQTAAGGQTNYLYDLKKLIEKSRENIKEVNEKIKEEAVLKRNQKREERAREYYEKGLELANEGKLDEARDYFEKAIRITEHPEMMGYIKESQRRLRRQENALRAQEKAHYKQVKQDENARKEDVEQAYREAVDLYKQKKYHPAKDAFEHVNEIAPDYRATDSYLKIIDQEIIATDALAAKQQVLEIQRQKKEAEAARAKEKQAWLAQIEEKEKEHKESVDKQAAHVYDEAVELYKKRKFAEAKKKFEEVSWVIPDYKATMKYLARIDMDAQQEQERVAREQEKALQEQRWEEEAQKRKQEAQQQKDLEVKERQRKKALQEQAEFLYKAAVSLYDKRDMDGALEKFNDIEKLFPNFKSTRAYLAHIEQRQFEQQKRQALYSPGPMLSVTAPAPAAVNGTSQIQPAVAAPMIKMPLSLEEQQKQAQDIAALAEKSAKLYRQIADIANDRSTLQTKEKMAKVNEILNNLKENKQRLLHEMQEERQEAVDRQAEEVYEQAVELYKNKRFAEAIMKFEAIKSVIPDYKATRSYLSRIKNDLKTAQAAQGTHYEQNKVEHLQLSQGKESTEMLRLAQEAQERHDIELQRQASLNKLAQKASDINDDIIRLSREQDYEAMKAKFAELENTVTALMTLKNEMKPQRRQEREKEMVLEARRRSEMLSFQKQGNQQIHEYYNGQALKENRPAIPPDNVDSYRHREILQEQNIIFNEGVDCYQHKQYTQAKLLFEELAQKRDRRAEVWIKKTDRAITQQLLKSEEREERERTAFIADQVKAQRELLIIQERERQRQKKLTEELERQKLLYEDNLSMQLRKEETLKAQERERERQEAKRLKQEEENRKQQEVFRFHKIETATKPQAQPVVVTPPVASVSLSASDRQRQAQLEARREAVRKRFLDGVEGMYQDALKLYKQGKYSAAANGFKVLQDIFPGYKRTEEYLDKVRLKSLNANASATPITTPGTSVLSHQDIVSKALDLFDSDVK